MFLYDHVEEYKDSFLQFGQNNGIETHFTDGKDGVAREVNRAVLEKVQYLLSNASLDKSFQAEAIVYASHLLNRLSTTMIGGKTLQRFGQVELLMAMVHLEYLVVWPMLMSRKTCWTLKRTSWCFRIQKRLERLQVMGSEKQGVRLETCHIG